MDLSYFITKYEGFTIMIDLYRNSVEIKSIGILINPNNGAL